VQSLTPYLTPLLFRPREGDCKVQSLTPFFDFKVQSLPPFFDFQIKKPSAGKSRYAAERIAFEVRFDWLDKANEHLNVTLDRRTEGQCTLLLATLTGIFDRSDR
jgi:hypothetical protein